MDKIKNNKVVALAVLITIVVIVAIVVLVLCLNNSKDNVNKPVGSNTVNMNDIKGINGKKSKAQKDADKKKDDAWANINVEEGGSKSKKKKQVLYETKANGEIVTNKKGQKVTRKASYPGEDEGWSPIVSPEDLKKHKKK